MQYTKIPFIIFILSVCFGCNDQKQVTAQNTVDSKNWHKAQSVEADGASADLKFSYEQLDNTKGLSNSSVNCIFQDSEKLLWIGTWDGLNRYDGNNFRIFRSEPNNANTLSNQVILKIGEDRSGQIWILTIHGINRYNKKTDSFTHFYFDRQDKPPLSESEFNMALDPSQNVYCAVKDWGIGYFDGIRFQKLGNTGFSGKTIRKILFSPSGQLLVLTADEQLFALSVATAANGEKVVSGTKFLARGIRTFDVLKNQAICVVSSQGEASLISTESNTVQRILQKNTDNIIGRIPEGIMLSGKDGYSIRDENGNTVDKPWLKYLKSQKITTLLQGSENVVWTGTDGDGVFKMFPLKKSFYLVSKNQVPELDGGIVRTFLDNGSAFWIGTKGKGLFRLPPGFYLHPENSLSYQNFNENNSVLNNSVFALCKGNDNLLLIGTDGAGVTVYDAIQSKLVSWPQIRGSEKGGYFKSVYSISQDKAGFTWLGTNGYGMIRCRIVRDGGGLAVTDFKQYLANASVKDNLSSNIIFSITQKSDDELWIGTRLGGLNLFNKTTGRFRTFKNDSRDPHTLSNNDILCLAKDAGGKLWIGTSFGLNVMESLGKEGKATFKSYTVKDGLPDNTIHGIVSDTASNLWVSTNSGLSTFIRDTGKFVNYSKNDGLQNNEFADGAFYSDPGTGYIFMGGIKGFNYYVPHHIKESSVLPDLLIDRISGQNQSVPYYQGLVISPDSKSYPSIVLAHDQNFFDIQLTALAYINNEKCQYAYKMEGFDKDWNVIGNRKIISFTNVPRGNYSLWMKWTNSDGVWSKPVHAVNIKVRPVFWQSDVALLLYSIMALAFILFVRSYNLKKQSLKQNILIRENEEKLHENRLSFFTDIAHEFLTPLTLMIGPVQKLSEVSDLGERNNKFVHMIQRNASRLLFLTQQLLEFRKAEYEHLEVVVRKFDMVSLVEQIAELFDNWALDKSIDYKLEIPSALPGWFDKDKIEKILFNLMSNAFKYTPPKGKIALKLEIEGTESTRLNITVRNTGKGIPKEKLASLFDRFFLSDANQKLEAEMFRTGIGLAYIKKLVTVLRGEILVSSIENEETVFTILIPCDRQAFTEKEIDPEKAPVLISSHLKNILEEHAEQGEAVPEKISLIDSAENTRQKILLVEDEKEIHLFLNDLLGEKYRILTAYNGVEALKIMETDMPDLIISDVMMPEMDGVELCKRVKHDINTCHIPFIMLTARESVLHRIEGLESGANSYIPKPFYPDHLMVRVQKLLEERALIMKYFTQENGGEDLSALPANNEDKVFMRSVINLIRENIDNEKLDSAFIEKHLGISNSQLYRKTKQVFEISPGDLIRTLRLKYSAELLRKNVMTVSEVCYKSGFNNRSYFYREFKKLYNMTPKNYQLHYKTRRFNFSNN